MKKASGTALVEAPQWLRDGLNEQLPDGEGLKPSSSPLCGTIDEKRSDSLLTIRYHHFFPLSRVGKRNEFSHREVRGKQDNNNRRLDGEYPTNKSGFSRLP